MMVCSKFSIQSPVTEGMDVALYLGAESIDHLLRDNALQTQSDEVVEKSM